MNKILLVAITASLISMIATFQSVSQQPANAGNQPDARRQAQIDALLSLSPAQRRAQLKQLAPSERRGLWYQMKQVQVQRRGTEAAPRGAYKSGALNKPVTGGKQLAKAIGTIRYDSGAITTSFGGGAIIGNRFNTNTGVPVLASGTVDTIQAVVVPGPAVASNSAGFVLLGPQTAGGGAFAIFSTFTGAATGTTDTVTFAGIGANYTGSSFLVLFGDFANSYVPAFGTGTTLGQGHHGIVGYTGGMGPNITGTVDFGGTLNGFIRATGNILPVELMQYKVD